MYLSRSDDLIDHCVVSDVRGGRPTNFKCSVVCTKIIADWTARGELNVYIEYNLDANPLQIRTDSLVGSEDFMSVAFYTVAEDISTIAGGIKIQFTYPPTLMIVNCDDYVQLENVPAEQVRKYYSKRDGTRPIGLSQLVS